MTDEALATGAPSKLPVRVGLALAAALYLVYSSFGIAAPFWWGHHGYHGATYMLRARMSLRLHMLSPATWTGYDAPPLNALYFHHPIGYHHLLTLLVPIFGEHEWLARGVAVLGGLLLLWALYALVARFWSREAGLLAVWVYVCLPVIASFSVLSDPMLLAFACVAWALWAYGELLERPSTRLLVHAACAYGIGGLIMWESYFIAPFIALHALAYRFTARGRTLKLGSWSALDLHTGITGAVCATTMAFHLWFTRRAGAWEEFLQSYALRHSPPSAQWVLERHAQWIEILFGAPLLGIGAAWLVVFLARAASGRARRRDLFPLTFLYVNTIYIYMFAEGSSVHLYRVFFFSGFFTLATVDLIVDAARATRRLDGTRAGAIATAVLLAATYFAVETPHAYANLIESRVLMGTHSQPAYSPEQEKLAFAAEVTRLTTPSDRVIVLYRQLGSRKEFWYYLDRSLDEIGSLAELTRLGKTQAKSVLIADERMLSGSERQLFDQLLAKHPVSFFGRFALVDLRSSQPGVRSFEFVPGPMSPAYRWFVSSTYPPLKLERRAYLPGLCDAVELGVPVAHDEALPRAAAIDAKSEACYHNYLLARGAPPSQIASEAQRATAGLATLDRALGGARLIAAGVVRGRLRVALRAGGPETGDLRYQVRYGAAPSTVPRGDGIPPPRAWRAGHLYLDDVALPPGSGPIAVEAQLFDVVAPPPLPQSPPVPAPARPTTKALPPGPRPSQPLPPPIARVRSSALVIEK